jgi:hypothetical protein
MKQLLYLGFAVLLLGVANSAFVAAATRDVPLRADDARSGKSLISHVQARLKKLEKIGKMLQEKFTPPADGSIGGDIPGRLQAAADVAQLGPLLFQRQDGSLVVTPASRIGVQPTVDAVPGVMYRVSHMLAVTVRPAAEAAGYVYQVSTDTRVAVWSGPGTLSSHSGTLGKDIFTAIIENELRAAGLSVSEALPPVIVP